MVGPSMSNRVFDIGYVFRFTLGAVFILNIAVLSGLIVSYQSVSRATISLERSLASDKAGGEYLALLDRLVIGLISAQWDNNHSFERVLGEQFRQLDAAASAIESTGDLTEAHFAARTAELRRVAESALIARWNLSDMSEIYVPSLLDFDRMVKRLTRNVAATGEAARAQLDPLAEEAETIIAELRDGMTRGDIETLSRARARLTAFSDRLEDVERALKAAGIATRAIFRGTDGPRSRLYQIVMQSIASRERFTAAWAEFDRLQGQVREAALRMRDEAQTQSRNMAGSSKNLALLIVVVLGFSAVVILAGALLAGRWLNGQLVRPLDALGHAMRRLAAGDLNATSGMRSRFQIVNSMTASVEVFRESMRRRNELEGQRLAEETANNERRLQLENAVANFNATSQERLATTLQAVEEIEVRAAQLAEVAGNIGRRSEAAREKTAEVHGSIGHVAQDVGHLSNAANRIAMSGEEAARMTVRVVEQTQFARRAVEGVTSASASIISVVDLIQSIASKTNLLALNATIEAARAGAAGRGFAVVASEVKELATQTAQATQVIAREIEAIRNTVGESLESIMRVSSGVNELEACNQTIAGEVLGQSAATTRIEQQVDSAVVQSREVMRDVGDLAEAVSLASRTARELALAARAVEEQSRELHMAVERAAAA